jgi:hypothetical protein
VAGLTYGLAGIGAVLVVAGAGALLRPQWIVAQGILVEGLGRYALLAITAGLGWLVPWGAYRRRAPRSASNTALWQGGWLLGPWGAIALLYATGLWGNYNPDVKLAMTTPPLEEIVAENPVSMVFRSISPTDEDSVLLTFYTPHLGRATGDWRTLESGSYTWITTADLIDLPEGTLPLGQVRDWALVQIP